MVGPVDPSLIMPSAKLPRPASFEHWRNRVVCRLLGRVSREDFDFAFETICKWMEGRTIDLAQARASAVDIGLATMGVLPTAFAARCEQTDVVLLTFHCPGHQGEPAHQRTRLINIKEPGDTKASPEPVSLQRRRARG